MVSFETKRPRVQSHPDGLATASVTVAPDNNTHGAGNLAAETTVRETADTYAVATRNEQLLQSNGLLPAALGDPAERGQAAVGGASDVKAATVDKQWAYSVVDQSLSLLGIHANAATDPTEIRSVLSDMKLLDFEPSYPPMRDFFAGIKAEPQAMKPMLDSVREGLAEHNPAVVDFLSTAAEHGWLYSSPAVQTALNMGYVLEAMTVAMANSVEFSCEVEAHIKAKRREYGIDTRNDLSTIMAVWKSTGRLFLAAKLMSVDPVVKYINTIRHHDGTPLDSDELARLSRSEGLTWVEHLSLKPGKPGTSNVGPLKINICEAAVTEYGKGYKDNALTADVLNQVAEHHQGQVYLQGPVVDPRDAAEPISPVHAAAAKEDGFFPHDQLTDDWARLYETWNMAFVLSDCDDLQVLLPKLLIPSVLNAPGETYIGNRALALWLAINTLIFRRMDGKKAIPAPADRKEMARAWGAINKEHALALAKKDLHENPEETVRRFHDHFRIPLLHFIHEAASWGLGR